MCVVLYQMFTPLPMSSGSRGARAISRSARESDGAASGVPGYTTSSVREVASPKRPMEYGGSPA